MHWLGGMRLRNLKVGLLAITLAAVGASAGEVRLRQVEPELGDALGFMVCVFEAELDEGEWLVVEERWELPSGKETVMLFVSGGLPYRVALVDSGRLHPSLSGTYMLSYPNHQTHLDEVWLGHTEIGSSVLKLEFAKPRSNEIKEKKTWSAFVVGPEEFAKKWPTVEVPQVGAGAASRLLVKLEDRPASEILGR